MQESYWSSIATQRLNRRRALAITGGAAAAAAFLAACGGGSSGGDSQDSTSGLITKPVEVQPGQAKRGGVLKLRTTSDTPSFEVQNPINPLNPSASLVYSLLVKRKIGVLEPSDGSMVPDLAESWEFSGDATQITMKLRQGVKWHNKAPVNGRAFDMEDVMHSYTRFSAKATGRTGIINALNPDAPVLSVTATDARTLVIKLKEPLVYGLELFGPSPGSYTGSIVIVPKETDSTFQINTDQIGTGPFTLGKYEPSVGFTMRRNPDYWDKDWVLVDQVDLPIISEVASAVAQFKAGNIYYGSGISAVDTLPVKREEPRLSMFATDAGGSTNVLTFGLLPEGVTPFLDIRVRQAFSMGWDRDLWLDVFGNITEYEAEGLPIEKRWSSALVSSQDGWWLDPRDKAFGPNGKNFQHNIAEAKKLLAAAGFPNGMSEQNSNHILTNELGNLPRSADILDGMVAEIGIPSKPKGYDYLREYIPLLRDAHGQHDGWSYHTSAGGTGVGPVGLIANQYWSKGGSAFHGFSTSGKNDQSGDPQLDAMIVKARGELDEERRRTQVYDIQRYLGDKIYALLVPGGSSGFALAWPCVGNYQVYRASANYRLWIDETKAPFV
jgi:peptide/nickel transport system substrate-binding protein